MFLFVPLNADTKIPRVNIATDNKTFDVGEKVTLTCKIENQKPFFDVKWIREETKQVLMIANFSYDPGRLYHKLDYIIGHVSIADAGNYTCVANYHDGSQQDSYMLKVEGKYCYHLELPLTVYLTLLYSPPPPPPPTNTHTHAYLQLSPLPSTHTVPRIINRSRQLSKRRKDSNYFGIKFCFQYALVRGLRKKIPFPSTFSLKPSYG